MQKHIIILLMMLLCAMTIGHVTCKEVNKKIQMRRRSSRRKMDFMALSAMRKNGKLGVYPNLIIT